MGQPRSEIRSRSKWPRSSTRLPLMDNEMKRAVALFRFGVLGPLVSARLEHGDRKTCFDQAAERRHIQPDGREIRLSARTIEGWYYSYKKGGFDALIPDARADEGKS